MDRVKVVRLIIKRNGTLLAVRAERKFGLWVAGIYSADTPEELADLLSKGK